MSLWPDPIWPVPCMLDALHRFGKFQPDTCSRSKHLARIQQMQTQRVRAVAAIVPAAFAQLFRG